MTPPATPIIDSDAWAVLAGLLEYVGDVLGPRVCNDYEIPDTPTNRAFVRAMNEWSEPDALPEDKELLIYDGNIIVMDWQLTGYFAHLARELAGLE